MTAPGVDQRLCRDLAAAMIAAGFDDFNEYSDWLRLDGARQLRLILGEMENREGEVFNRLCEVLHPEPAGAGRRVGRLLDGTASGQQHPLRLPGLARRCGGLVHRVLVRHSFAPSSVGPVDRSVGAPRRAGSASHVGDDTTGGER